PYTRVSILLNQPRHIPGQHVDFKINWIAGFRHAPGGDGLGVRNDVYPEARSLSVSAGFRVFDLVYRERSAVEGYGPLWSNKAAKPVRRLEGEAERVPLRPDIHDMAHTIDMAADHMSAKLVARLERAFEIDPRTLGPGAERRAVERLLR